MALQVLAVLESDFEGLVGWMSVWRAHGSTGQERRSWPASLQCSASFPSRIWSCDKMFRSLLVHFGAMGQRAARGGMLQATRWEIYLGERLAEKRGRCALQRWLQDLDLDGEVDEKTGSDLMDALTHTTPALQLRSGRAGSTPQSSHPSNPIPCQSGSRWRSVHTQPCSKSRDTYTSVDPACSQPSSPNKRGSTKQHAFLNVQDISRRQIL
jgi:hypothetical protein